MREEEPQLPPKPRPNRAKNVSQPGDHTSPSEVVHYQNDFALTGGKLPILLKLKKTQELHPHEQTVPVELQSLINALEQDPVLRHPIIADSASGVVLDGTHRLSALSELGCYSIPTALIDYQNPLVQVDRWFRIISGPGLHRFRKRIEALSPQEVDSTDAGRDLLNRSIYASLRGDGICLAFKSPNPAALELALNAFRIEQIAREEGLKVTYTDSGNVIGPSGSSLVMSTIRLEKREVVESSLSSALFPPKTTRHLIPSRPLGLGIPLAMLKNTDLAQAESILTEHLRSKKVKRLPEGSWVGSRRYMEEVFVFE